MRMTFAEAPDVLTVPEAAALARIGRSQLYQAIRRGDLYAARIGRTIRVPKLSLLRLMEGPVATSEPHLEVVAR